jgi:bacterial leucyl aminopeptidase
MKFSAVAALAVATVSAASARNVKTPGQDVLAQAQYLIEMSPGETKWVTEEEKWELKRVS